MKALSLGQRAVLALALMIGFYALALAIAAALLFAIYAEFAYLKRFNLQLTLACLIGAFTIIKAIVPRIDRFTPPGPRLDPSKQPRLFAEIAGVASAVGQPMLKDVYLTPDVNAFVSQRGGVMGFGSRRVMGVGLGLLQSLTVSQARAVLAHEFGHYHSGDVALGPWVYKTYNAIERTLNGLGEGVLQAPFRLYAKMFLRLTQAISRRQEFVADELAARTVGTQALTGSLLATHGAAAAFASYWESEVAPILSQGYRPALAEGFSRFLQVENIKIALERTIAKAKETPSDPHDTHPTLQERLAAAEKLPAGTHQIDETPATSLLNDIADLERGILLMIGERTWVDGLKPLAWEDAGTKVYIPIWEKNLPRYRQVLAGITVESLPGVLVEQASTLGKRLEKVDERLATDKQAVWVTLHTLSSALGLLLHKQGWVVETSPGSPIVFRKGEIVIDPRRVVGGLYARDLSADAWQAQCAAAGISGLALSSEQRATSNE